MSGPSRPSFIELFAGGGFARAGLEGWRCLLANDIDPAKARSYRANWGDAVFLEADVSDLRPDMVSERADLVWASPPCQDFSHAGGRRGLAGQRSSAIWPALDFVRGLIAAGRGPRLVVIENVLGMLTSSERADFQAIVRALLGMGYRCGGLVGDAASFVPQSRQRVFLVAVARDVTIPATLAAPQAVLPWHPKTLVEAARPFSRWNWFLPPEPPSMRARLADLLDADGVAWHADRERQALLALMTAETAEVLEQAREDRVVVGTLTKRMRSVLGGRRQRAELRIDGFAGCLRTPAGGSSQQALVLADPLRIRTRRLSVRECSRLMGIPEGYILPQNDAGALRLIGEGVVVPVVRHLASGLLRPLLGSGPADVEPNDGYDHGLAVNFDPSTYFQTPDAPGMLSR